MAVRVSRAQIRRLCREAGEPMPEAPSRSYPPGAVVAEFTVYARAVPWSVSRHRGGKSPRLVEWQAQVRGVAARAMGGRPPHDGPFSLSAEFVRTKRGTDADLCNLVKGTEDALQGVVYTNDRHAVAHDSHVVRGDVDRLKVVVLAIGHPFGGVR